MREYLQLLFDVNKASNPRKEIEMELNSRDLQHYGFINCCESIFKRFPTLKLKHHKGGNFPEIYAKQKQNT